MSPTAILYTVDEYDAQEFDGVLVQENTAVCLRNDEARIIPLDKINRVDCDPETFLATHEIPETFFGGGDYGFVNVAEFPALEQHLEEIDREQY